MWLTYKGAARRVRRSRDTIRRWRRAGMPMGFDEEGRRIVEEAVLLEWFRARLLADPIMAARRRARAKQHKEEA